MRQRVESLRFWIVFFLYVTIGLGGGWAFSAVVQDAAWQEIFYSVWWLPSGVMALWITHKATHWLTAWVPDTSSQQQ